MKESLTKHEKSHLSEDVRKKSSCGKCGRKFANLTHLKQHVVYCMREYPVNQTGKKLNSILYLFYYKFLATDEPANVTEGQTQEKVNKRSELTNQANANSSNEIDPSMREIVSQDVAQLKGEVLEVSGTRYHISYPRPVDLTKNEKETLASVANEQLNEAESVTRIPLFIEEMSWYFTHTWTDNNKLFCTLKSSYVQIERANSKQLSIGVFANLIAQ